MSQQICTYKSPGCQPSKNVKYTQIFTYEQTKCLDVHSIGRSSHDKHFTVFWYIAFLYIILILNLFKFNLQFSCKICCYCDIFMKSLSVGVLLSRTLYTTWASLNSKVSSPVWASIPNLSLNTIFFKLYLLW